MLRGMDKIFGHFRANVFLYAGVLVVLLVVAALVSSRSNGDEELLTVTRSAFVQEVSVSGKVVAAQDVELSFPETGRVASLSVEVGDTVREGQALASLASATLISQLRAAEADLALRKAEARNTSVNLDEVKAEQNAMVESAYRTLLSDDLVATPESSYGVKAPTITGLYTGSEGSYRIRIAKIENSEDFELRTFSLELFGPVEILDDEPTPLGTKGLFIDFPDTLSSYKDTIWTVVIPNVKGDSYLDNRRAYDEALSTRSRVVAEAEGSLRSGDGKSVADARIQSAEAEVARIRAAIAERTLRAPFSGVITAVDAKLGGVVAANERAVSLISTGALQIESYVPEVNIALIEVRDPANVTLDAYSDDVVFVARVVSIDPAETIRDGVSTYRTILQFDEQDERIKSGMTANVTITTDVREDVISIPQGVVSEREGKKYVRLIVGKEIEEREVTTGAVSNLGNVEIISGLSEGEQVVLSP